MALGTDAPGTTETGRETTVRSEMTLGRMSVGDMAHHEVTPTVTESLMPRTATTLRKKKASEYCRISDQ